MELEMDNKQENGNIHRFTKFNSILSKDQQTKEELIREMRKYLGMFK